MGGSATFVSEPFTGVRPDKLLQHEKSHTHESAASSYREQLSRDASQLDVVQVMTRANTLTVDEEAFADALRCMYHLNKHEVAHTSNFKSLNLFGKYKISKAKNLNYESEMTMQEMVKAIETIEEDIITEAALSPYYSLIFDEVTDVSVHKQLGLCIQYVNPSGKVVARNLKLLELQQGTADYITQAISASQLDLQKMAGGASDGAAVMMGMSMV